jgi:hypothetical protein
VTDEENATETAPRLKNAVHAPSGTAVASATTVKMLPLIMLCVALPGCMLHAQQAMTAAPPLPKPVDVSPRTVKVGNAEAYTLGFHLLSAFPYVVTDIGTGASATEVAAARTRDQVPDWIRVYDGKRVLLTGFMMPLQFENGVCRKFVMMRDTNTCCYGSTPNMNDYVVVTMKGKGIAVVQDVPVDLTGVFRVDEKYEDGYLVSLFVMDGETFQGPRK